MFDRDEGFHAMAADLVGQGRVPWRDFTYLHPPGLAWILAPFGGDPFRLRWVTAALGGLSLGLLAGGMAGKSGRAGAAAAAFLMLTHPCFLSWMGTVKTYAATGALSIGAILLLDQFCRRPLAGRGMLLLLASATLLGGAIMIRLPCVALALLGTVWLAITSAGRWRILHAALFLFVAIVIPLAAMILTGATWQQAWFNAIGSHNEPVTNPLGQRLDTLRELAGDPQILVLMIAGVSGFIPLGWFRSAASGMQDAALPRLVAILLTVGYLLAQPTYAQYWTFALPFWIWSITPLLAVVLASRRRLLVLVPLLAIWLGITLAERGMILAPVPTQLYFSRSEVADARRAVKASVPAGGVVASIWPGYIAGTGLRPAPGLENTLGFRSAATLVSGERRLFHVLTIEEYGDLLQSREPEGIVITTEDAERHPFLQRTPAGYTLVHGTEHIMVLVRTRSG